MAVINFVLLASAVLPAVIAVPQHGHFGHRQHKRNELPSGYSTGGFPHPSGIPGTAPYPAQNSTVGGATGTGSGPVTIQSTVNIIPMPVTHTKYAASSTGGIDQSGASGSPGSGSSGSGSGSGSGNGEKGSECGPATVTVTQANTVTVTIGGSNGGSPTNGGSPSNAPVQSSPAGSLIPASSSALYPIGNSSVPAGPTGTVGTILPSIPTQVPVPTSAVAPSSSSASIIELASSTAPSSAPVISSSAPVEAASSATSTPAAPVSASSVEAHAYYHIPGAGGQQQHTSVTPVVAASSTPVSFPAAVASSSVTPAPSSASQAASSAPASSSSSIPVKSNTGLKARGLLYGGPDANSALSGANSYLSAGNGAMGWGWNWDSSPAPASGHKTGTLNVQFVPMLLSAIDTHTSLWDDNSAGYPYLMGFNEPDMTTDKGGSGMDVDTCVQNWNTYMQPKASGSVKLISPATTNDLDDANMGLHYMTSFLEKCSSCTIDVLAFHYYGKADDLEYFKNTVQQYKNLQTQHNIPELWITEMAPTALPTKDQMDAFLAYLDGESGVARYAFNGLNTGTGQNLDSGVMKDAYCS